MLLPNEKSYCMVILITWILIQIQLG